MNADRRPLKTRSARWAQDLARRLADKGVSPNTISALSLAAAALGGALFWLSAHALPALCLLGAALFCQLRLLCNLLDGLVAIEGGRAAPDGPLWNEAPDRPADLLLLAGAGAAAGLPALGWAAGALAILTAYIREFGRAEGLPSDYRGPMAKPHRMAALTAGAIFAALTGSTVLLTLTLWIIVLGTIATAVRRALTLRNRLRMR
ncbi:CDP-alcohol phosphatidyltransferase family protein [Aestuariibius sp. 2305UL40-4]|uniref:CDP-alcohol phosphatidyltransferase family protein n=1 Tax=Aestuariibius violaceus TaxID=3234132 RepID=UPI00345E93B1